MTKEKIFEELLAKRSAASQGSSNDDGSLDWQKTGGLDEEQLKIGKSPSHRGALHKWRPIWIESQAQFP